MKHQIAAAAGFLLAGPPGAQLAFRMCGPIPPTYGTVPVLGDLIEITCLEDDAPRYIERNVTPLTTAEHALMLAEIEHRERMGEMHRQTMREARIATALILAAIVAAGLSVAEFAGLL